LDFIYYQVFLGSIYTSVLPSTTSLYWGSKGTNLKLLIIGDNRRDYITT